VIAAALEAARLLVGFAVGFSAVRTFITATTTKETP
jgi:hypothetical protein